MLLWLLQNPIIRLFKLEGEAAELMSIFCTWVAITFIFNGAQFIANTTFNNLGKPMYATGFNVAKSTLGTLPFVALGGQLGGAAGVLIGVAVGGMIFAVAAVVIAFRHIETLAHQTDH
jgi:Na+-driven multidrug efflux pump